MTGGLMTIARITLHEAARRRLLLAAFICGAAFLALYATGLYFIERNFTQNNASLI